MTGTTAATSTSCAAHLHQLAGWSGSMERAAVSDDNYFVDYSRSILSSSERVLPRTFTTSRWLGSDWTLMFTRRSATRASSMRASPALRARAAADATHTCARRRGFDLETIVDATQFRRPWSGRPRAGGWWSIRRSAIRSCAPAGSVVPKLGLHLSTYQSRQPGAARADVAEPVVPVFSLDAGLVFERDAELLRPRRDADARTAAVLRASPYRDQASPCRCSTPTVADFNFAQLFADNTFIGNDRIADVDQLTTALVSRLIEPRTGAESLRLRGSDSVSTSRSSGSRFRAWRRAPTRVPTSCWAGQASSAAA